jgi:hypothetical protein
VPTARASPRSGRAAHGRTRAAGRSGTFRRAEDHPGVYREM